MTLKDRVSALEGASTEVETALQGIIDRHDSKNRAVINKVAHQAIIATLAGFPAHAREYVVGLFEARAKTYREYGHSEASALHGGYGCTVKKPGISDLLLEPDK